MLAAVDIDDGRVDITFGNEAHQDIQGGTVSFTPYIAAGGTIVWRCAGAAAPAGTTALTGGGVTSVHAAPTIDARYSAIQLPELIARKARNIAASAQFFRFDLIEYRNCDKAHKIELIRGLRSVRL